MIDPHNRPRLGDDTLRLRAPVIADVEARLALGSTPEILHMFGVYHKTMPPFTLAMAEDWVETQLQEPMAFVIIHEGRMIGALRLHSFNFQDKRASLAIGILDSDLLGKGIGPRAIALLLDHAFGVIGLNRVVVRVVDYNTRAIAAYTKMGFVTEGRERQAARVGETYHDDIIMGLLASEWRS